MTVDSVDTNGNPFRACGKFRSEGDDQLKDNRTHNNEERFTHMITNDGVSPNQKCSSSPLYEPNSGCPKYTPVNKRPTYWRQKQQYQRPKDNSLLQESHPRLFPHYQNSLHPSQQASAGLKRTKPNTCHLLHTVSITPTPDSERNCFQLTGDAQARSVRFAGQIRTSVMCTGATAQEGQFGVTNSFQLPSFPQHLRQQSPSQQYQQPHIMSVTSDAYSSVSDKKPFRARERRTSLQPGLLYNGTSSGHDMVTCPPSLPQSRYLPTSTVHPPVLSGCSTTEARSGATGSFMSGDQGKGIFSASLSAADTEPSFSIGWASMPYSDQQAQVKKTSQQSLHQRKMIQQPNQETPEVNATGNTTFDSLQDLLKSRWGRPKSAGSSLFPRIINSFSSAASRTQSGASLAKAGDEVMIASCSDISRNPGVPSALVSTVSRSFTVPTPLMEEEEGFAEVEAVERHQRLSEEDAKSTWKDILMPERTNLTVCSATTTKVCFNSEVKLAAVPELNQVDSLELDSTAQLSPKKHHSEVQGIGRTSVIPARAEVLSAVGDVASDTIKYSKWKCIKPVKCCRTM